MLPHNIATLITSMLNVDPKKRPSAEEIIIELNALTRKGVIDIKEDTIKPQNSDWFHPAGDL